MRLAADVFLHTPKLVVTAKPTRCRSKPRQRRVLGVHEWVLPTGRYNFSPSDWEASRKRVHWVMGPRALKDEFPPTRDDWCLVRKTFPRQPAGRTRVGISPLIQAQSLTLQCNGL